MHCLVTGGAGLIGSHIVDKLIEQGHEVTILDNLDSQTHPKGKPSWIPKEARFIEGDVNNYDDVKKALDGVDAISHQAAFGGFTNSISYYFDINTTGTAKIFEVIREEKININKFIIASSQAIFGEGLYRSDKMGNFHPETRSLEQLKEGRWEVLCPENGTEATPVPFSENLEPYGVSPYALSKYFEEMIGLAFGETYDIPVATLRYAVTYGPRQSIFNPYTGIFSIFSSMIVNDLPPLIFEDGKQTRDFIYVEDVADANIVLLNSNLNSQEPFNVGTGKGTKVIDLANALCKELSQSVKPKLSNEFRYGDSRHFVHNSEKLRSYGWEPKHTIDNGIKKYTEWFKTQENVETTFPTASEGLRDLGIIQSSD
tara:strand:+ start:7452 stop:8564 length:1113 start_codon:yes stop_codon:yes gene_type:complete